ncbi:hypothetical protein CHU98_g10361, partial [Xylaria longipes]
MPRTNQNKTVEGAGRHSCPELQRGADPRPALLKVRFRLSDAGAATGHVRLLAKVRRILSPSRSASPPSARLRSVKLRLAERRINRRHHVGRLQGACSQPALGFASLSVCFTVFACSITSLHRALASDFEHRRTDTPTATLYSIASFVNCPTVRRLELTPVRQNLFTVLGTEEEDEPQPSGPVKTVEKTLPRTTKRNVEPQAPIKPAGTTGTRRAGPGGNEGAFRDRNAGHNANQRKPTDEEVSRGSQRGGRGARERGGRGGRFPRDRDDRHTKGFQTGGSEKQAAQSWGATEGGAEAKDEQAGEEIAQTELKEATAEDAEDVATPAEPEDKHVSYTDYLAQQAEKKLALGDSLEIRKPNEGTKVDKKWASAKALSKDEGDDFISATGGKTKRERERKAKQVVEIDNRFVEPERPRGGRGGRGGASRGGARG